MQKVCGPACGVHPNCQSGHLTKQTLYWQDTSDKQSGSKDIYLSNNVIYYWSGNSKPQLGNIPWLILCYKTKALFKMESSVNRGFEVLQAYGQSKERTNVVFRGVEMLIRKSKDGSSEVKSAGIVVSRSGWSSKQVYFHERWTLNPEVGSWCPTASTCQGVFLSFLCLHGYSRHLKMILLI